MLKFRWFFKSIHTEQDIEDMKASFLRDTPKYGAFDTETTGLDIIHSRPFILPFGYIELDNQRGMVWAADLRTHIGIKAAQQWCELAKGLEYLAGHNVKFDLHMLRNIEIIYDAPNITDTTFWIRYGNDALHIAEGGPPLGLKEYAARYITPDAKLHEKNLAVQRKNIAKDYNAQLKNKLGITLKQLNKYTDDCTFEISDLPENLKEAYMDWYMGLPIYLQKKVTSKVESSMIRYDTLNYETTERYAMYDVVYTLEILYSLIPKINARANWDAIKLENQLIYPLVKMERVGFTIDLDYLESCRQNMRSYIRQRRQDLKDLINEDLKINQHAKIKQIIHDKFAVTVESTGNEQLERLYDTTTDTDLKEFIHCISELRTLEKWYSVYIIRFQQALYPGEDKIYTTINQVGTVSGRVTSDFQQFPRTGIKDKDGNELFNPRRMIKTNTGIVYLDYSQIELRFQAFYTILVGTPDKNMCRAYEPYECHTKEGIQFNYTNPEHIKNAYNGNWFRNEDNKAWTPVDVHGATTTAATGLQPSDPGFKKARYDIGKRVNFAKNYGASIQRIRQMFPDKTEEEVKRIDSAYYTAFPGVKAYHTYCYNRAQQFSHTENLFGIRYYNVSGHKLRNMLIQGSAAFYLKKKIIELDAYCIEHNIKSKWQMQIHDELSWEYNPEDPPEIFFKFKEIMEDWSEAYIPIIADMEATNSTWSNKQDIETLQDLKGVLHD